MTNPIKPTDRALDTYYANLDILQNQQGAEREGSLRSAFAALLKVLSKPKKWTLIEEDAQKVGTRTIYYDGVLRDEWRLPHGWWEAKDSRDDLDREIRIKRERGYSFKNMLFEDTRTLVLFQDGLEAGRCALAERAEVARLLTQFFSYEIAPFDNFNAAITYFGDEIPNLARGLKERIDSAHRDNRAFQDAYGDFMELCQKALNPNLSAAAVDEMLIQHMLTERLMRKLFDEDFVQHNVIAREVERVITALTSASFNRKEFLGGLDRFYTVIEEAAEELASFTDKQSFINTVYERFFQGYSIKTADTHGIVYTPQPIVDFMCASVEEVLKDEFGLELGQEGVTILDPATGTGNFVVNLLGRVQEKYLDDFYKHQLFANEVMLMPYYIASLNIEATYYQRRGKRAAFEGMCFVDTLDLEVGMRTLDMFAPENTQRVTRQQKAPITVVIGNPPYNVGQVNENDNNKNRAYKQVDDRIRQTYAKDSQATLKMQLYDMYVRFFRWAIDRLGDRDGIVCYVTNNSFVDQYSFDSFRKHLMQDFTRVYHLDLHGNVRQNPKISGTTHNVFGIQVGVGVTVAIRSSKHADRKLFYHRVPEMWTSAEKQAFLAHHVEVQGNRNALNSIQWQELKPDKKHTWLIPENADLWGSYLPIGSKAGKATKGREPETIFRTYSSGIATNRDNDVYDFDENILKQRIPAFIEAFNSEIDRHKRSGQPKNADNFVRYDLIKWSRNLKRHLVSGDLVEFDELNIRTALYRPFSKRKLYFSDVLVDEMGQFSRIFPLPDCELENKVIWLKIGSAWPMFALISNNLCDWLPQGGSQCFPFYVYDEDGGNRRENITDWALRQFRQRYDDERISKWDIFYYVYALLHHPRYRELFAGQLKKELPRIAYLTLNPSPLHAEGLEGRGAGSDLPSPIARRVGDEGADLPSPIGRRVGDEGANLPSPIGRRVGVEGANLPSPIARRVGDEGKSGTFHQFARIGQALAELHLHYETGARANLTWQTKGTVDYRVQKMKRAGNSIVYNHSLTLADIPAQAWEYKLGNRSALDWVIDQYQVSVDKRSGISSDPNRYSDDEQYIVKLIERVTQVSVETVRLVRLLAAIPLESGEDGAAD